MNRINQTDHDLRMAQVESIAASRHNGDEREQVIGFVRSYFESVPDEVLAGLHPPVLYAVAIGHYRFSQQRAPDQDLVRVFRAGRDNPDHGVDACVLETTVRDCPFLVDTIAMAVRAAGGVIRWLIHPVLVVQRDADGHMQGVGTSLHDGPDMESLIHIHFDGLVDEAEFRALEQRVAEVLHDLHTAVADYLPMREKLAERVDELSTVPPGMASEDIVEVAELLRWLDLDHYTFLGYSEARVVGEGENARFEPVAEAGLGLYRDRGDEFDWIAPASELDKYAGSRRPVIITKADVRSHIHHDEYLDAISVKRFGPQGEVVGTCRFIGLFSTEVYNSLPKNIPVLRRKIDWVMQQAQSRPGSHAHKQLQEVLNGLPTDELFQSSEEELLELALGVRALRETQRLRLFVRRDRYRRFFSCLVYLQRDQYNAEVRERMARLLQQWLNGRDLEYHVTLQRDALARVQFIVRSESGADAQLTCEEMELRLQEATRSWDDSLRNYLAAILPDSDARRLADRFRGAFPLSYRENVAALEAATDLQYLNRLNADETQLVRLLDKHHGECDLRIKLYAYEAPASLSAVLPTLENFGLTVVTQRPYEIGASGAASLWVQEFDLIQTGVCALPTERMRTLFEDAYMRTLNGELEDDGFNALILNAGLTGRQAAFVRALCKYLLQTAWPYSQSYIESILVSHADLTAKLVQLFEASFDPHRAPQARDSEVEKLSGELYSALDAISSLDVDRVLRAYLSVISACLRTNFFQRTEQGKPKPYISFKLDPRQIDELPRPRPMFETFVYSPQVEGIHLRGGKVARGGLRWSDRRQDFRTEVLGLVKAQMVKNAVIVPVGAKGGFVVKQTLAGLDRDAIQKAGIACYKTFIRGLLDITDNLVDGHIRAPVDVVRQDDDDPYLVVAADKGTASFSDIANGVSAEYGFWLGDAFASGGSAGYDHKKMGITARGAWESVKRHFRELGRDCQREDFTCVGIGDMAGDVFGNGMLLSPHTRLIAAFNHLHIFIDPDPDASRSFDERKRLFELPRSSWSDYRSELISAGGGVFERSAKHIELSPQARQALGISHTRLTPTALIHEILQAPVDLLWNGGIGTYVKARQESHQDVGDRANDGLRVNGQELRCKIVGEGGNLGMTQLGRIEFALHGGRVITDFNDNAGGVNSSDREVNIKIPLNKLMAEESLAVGPRNALLESMTQDVANGVLRDSYLQTQALALMQRRAALRMDEHSNFMRLLERDQLLDRAIEFLPDDETLAQRRAAQQGLTLPEQAVLVSYSKIGLYEQILESSLPDDPRLERDLLEYFPQAMRSQYQTALCQHRLRREIIATLVTNQTVNRMGATFARRLAEDRGVGADRAARMYLAARDIFASESRFAAVEATDGELGTEVQYDLIERIVGLLKHASQWLLRNAPAQAGLDDMVARYRPTVKALETALHSVLPQEYTQQHTRTQQTMVERGASDELAAQFANHSIIGSALDVAILSEQCGFATADVACEYFRVGAMLSLPWLLASINQLDAENRWQALARNNLREDVYVQHRQVVARALQCEGDCATARVDAWQTQSAQQLEFTATRLAELNALGQPDFAALTIAMGELQRLSL